MEMSSNYFPGEVHVAQQSRRDKLRSSSSSSAQQHPDEFQNTNFPNNQLSPVALPSDMLNFAPNPGPFTSVNPNRFVSGFEFKPYGDGSWVGVSSYGGSEYVQNLENLHPSFVSNANPNHGLSLSLSSNQISEIRRLGFKSVESGSGSISSIVNQSKGNLTTHDSVRNLGPLGPFTGYTSILMSSKFMKPAQQLLDEFLSVAGLRYQREEGASKVVGTAVIVDCSNACGSNDLSGGCGNGYGDQSFRPDCHEKKAKLLNIQEEVCKRQKQYHQEIQMVISAFESVPGLASATPYISRSLKAISRHFKCLKSAIADQVKYIKNVLGEDLSSPASFSRGDCTSLRFSENLAKVKSGGFGSTGYQNHIWRPQRGLPERAVSVLRAWLFDHFLHPYPTDTDKQMLASQTGLSRNQVSNWFINARVRVWKPMVEEMHMLETKGVSRTEPNSDNSRMSSTVNKRQQDSDNQPSFQPNSLECSGHSSSTLRSRAHMTAEQFLQKHSGIETHRRHHHQVPTGSLDDGSFVGLLPYQRRGLEMGGIGPVSLTLGLRHGSETTQLQHHFQQQGMHFGGHIHDFSG